MSVVRIEAFGGEAPSISGQALPGDLAQRNVNLYAGIREFRPLMEDKDTGVAAAGAKTIYRTQRKPGGGYNGTENEGSNWRVDINDLQYVKGQVNDDATERTYFTAIGPSGKPVDFPKAFDLSSLNTPRRLGVPPPSALIASIVTGKSFTLEDTKGVIKEIAKTVAAAVEECIIDPRVDQRGARYKDFRPSNGVPKAATLTPRAGPYSNYGMGPTEEIASVLPAPYNEMHWLLYAVRPSIELRSIFGNQGMVDLGVIVSNIPASTNSSVTSYQAAVNINALPFCLIPDKPDPDNPGKTLLEKRLRTIKNPKDDSPLFDDEEIVAILATLVDGSRVERFAKNLRDELDQVVKEFAELVFNTTQASFNIPLQDVGPAPVAPVKPPRPGVSEYTTNGDEPGPMDPQWVQYYKDLATYDKNLIAYNTAKATYDAALLNRGADEGKLAAAQQGFASRVNALRNRAINISAQIEAKVLQIYQDEMTSLENLEIALIDGFGGAPALFGGLDDDRVKEPRFYVATYVTDWGEESANSPVTELVEPTQYDTVKVVLPQPPADRFVKRVRLYRGNAGSADNAAFQLVTEMDAQTLEFTDSLKAAQLGEGLVTSTWAEPDARMVGLVGMPNGIMAGFFDNTVCFSEPYAPYAWPVEYQITTEHPIVGLATFGQTLFVGTTGSPYFISGSDSASMSALKMDSNQSCVSRRSIVAVQGGVLYASPDGLCLADGRGIQVVSQGLFTREDWQALKPETILGAEHEGIYFMSYEGGDGGVFCFDLPSKKLTRLHGAKPTALFVDRLSDVLYYASAATGKIHRLYGGTVRRTGLWKSGRNPFPQHATLAWAQVEGFPTTQDPVLIRLYGDNYFIDYRGRVYEAVVQATVRQVNGQTVSQTEVTGWRRRSDGVLFVPGTPEHTAINYTVKLTDSNPVRLPPGRWRDHEIEVESKSRVTRVTLAGSLEELKSV